jgi:hypothetical protein
VVAAADACPPQIVTVLVGEHAQNAGAAGQDVQAYRQFGLAQALRPTADGQRAGDVDEAAQAAVAGFGLRQRRACSQALQSRVEAKTVIDRCKICPAGVGEKTLDRAVVGDDDFAGVQPEAEQRAWQWAGGCKMVAPLTSCDACMSAPSIQMPWPGATLSRWDGTPSSNAFGRICTGASPCRVWRPIQRRGRMPPCSVRIGVPTVNVSTGTLPLHVMTSVVS